VTISIDKNGVRIVPHARPAAKPGAAAVAASTPASSASGVSQPSPAAAAASADAEGVEIRLPPGADSETVREAVKEARSAVVEAIRDSAQEAADRARESADATRQAAEANRKAVRTIRRIHAERSKPPLGGLAWLFIVASAILKISYKGTIQAEVKAAEATETAESEQLKRQVVEARMAAMQAQVEPHFLFNTLASIDHLIETDPPRASQMQKNLIALLRASMPSMREAHPSAHNLGREMAVIRPYLEILKVRMEDRLQTSINVPEGLLSAEFPSMMIQSLVENAIKHGLEPKAEGGKLDVSAEILHGKLAVTVADTGLGFGRAETAGTGVGLANIRERLKLLYGDRASMVVADNSPSGTIVTLTVPYQAQMREGAST
jgi:two-component sensor histidine kinase